jgi:DNA polymerase III gamma/tau subunit
MNQIPSQVWVGQDAALKKQAISYLQEQFCVQPNTNHHLACKTCAICLQIANHQFHNVIWLEPDGQYKVDQIRQVLGRLSFSLGEKEKFYFVFTNAQALNDAGANSLLKSIEEPPAGYHFIFLVSRKELLLTTILSRSVIKYFNQELLAEQHELVAIFTNQKKVNAIAFHQLLESYKDLTEQESCTLLDQIYAYWLHQAKSVQNLQHLLVLQKMQNFLPMPGSSKLFWRNLYLQLYNS